MFWQMRVDPEILYIKALIADGAQGRIYQIRRWLCLSGHAAQPRVRIVLACRSDLQTRYIPDEANHASTSFTAVVGGNTTEIVGERGVWVQNWGDAPSAAERFDCAAPSLKWFLRDRGEWVVSDVEAPRAQAERIAGLAGPLAPAAAGRDARRMVLAC